MVKEKTAAIGSLEEQIGRSKLCRQWVGFLEPNRLEGFCIWNCICLMTVIMNFNCGIFE